MLVASAFLIALGFGLIAPSIPYLAASFGVSLAVAGLVFAVFSGARLVTAPIGGVLVNTFGERRMVVIGLVTNGIATGLIALAQEYWHFVALRAVAGVGSALFTLSATALLVRLAPQRIRGRCSSAYASGFLFGNILGPVVGSALAGFGPHLPFALDGVLVVAAAAVLWVRLPSEAGLPTRRGASGSSGNVSAPLPLRTALRDSAYRSALMGAFANGWTNIGARISLLPLFAATIFTHGAAEAGLALTAFAAGNALMLQFSGRMVDSLGRKPIVMTGFLLSAVFTAWLGTAGSLLPLLLLSTLAGAGAGLTIPAQQAVLADVVGAQRPGGKVVATFQMVQDLGAIASPVLMGLVVERWGFAVGFGLCGAMFGVALAVASRMRETLPKSGSHSGSID